MRPESRWRGLLETAAVLVAFVVYGLAWAQGLGRAVAAESNYPGQTVDATEGPEVWLLDGFNLLHAGPLGGRDRSGWWREPQRSELLALVDRFDDPTAEVWVVFDGPRDDGEGDGPSGSSASRLTRVFAPSADDWLLARVRSAEDPARIAVVTADKQLADRARHRGAKVYSPRAFLDRCTG